MKRTLFILFLSLSAALGCRAAFTPAQVPDVHKADREQFVSDPCNFISPQATAQLNAQLKMLRQQTSAEAMVVVLPSISDPDEPNEFATDLFELWGLGKADKDSGLLVLLVIDRRTVVIRPGYGLEGVLPDITCGRIIREFMIPAFKTGDYGQGLVNGVDIISTLLSDPAAADEFRSQQADNDYKTNSETDVFRIYLIISATMAIIMLLLMLLKLWQVRREPDYEKYQAMVKWRPAYLALTFLGIFIPLIASLPLVILLGFWRNKPRICPNCGQKMRKVDEVHDNDYLTPSQDLEERLGSVDYDVWLCPDCGETDIYPYIMAGSIYKECPRCHARTMRQTRERILQQPTTVSEGIGQKEYHCYNCDYDHNEPFKLPKKASEALVGAMAAGAILGSQGRGGGFSGGSFGGGFGGGHTGGGGASGSW